MIESDSQSKSIIYIHICQKGEWKRSFTMIMNKIKESKLYNNVNEIRCGVINDRGQIIIDPVLNDPKIKIIHVGYSHEYERPTLLHMRNANDDINTKYLYCHTKGIRWFGTHKENNVVDWINLLIYWNIERWGDAVLELERYDTYGCNFYKRDNFNPNHYSGNYFWVTFTHLKRLNNTIGPNYNDPEFWLFNINTPYSYFNAYSSGLEGMGHYDKPYPRQLYISLL